MGTNYNPQIVTSGLVYLLDPANRKCFTNTSTIIPDLVSSNTSVISGTYSYDTTSYSTPVITLNNNSTASDGKINITTVNLNTLALANTFTVIFAAKKNYYGLSGNNFGNSQIFQGVSDGYNLGWRLLEGTGGTPGNAFTGQHSWYIGYNDINTSHFINDSSSTNRMCIVAFSVSPTTITAFCNGTFTTRSNPGTYVGGTSSPTISYTGAGAGSWNGLIGYFAIYNKTLTSSEILQNFNALRGRYGL
tara:strand:- start:600 stop:1340 length:741 start_codon:yes stop_codon:yes gene_type:complete